MSKKIKITDLSKILGLSPTLISMVLNGKGKQNKISEATQQKVFEAARKLNYSPNQSARALRMGKTFVVGLIVPNISNTFYSKLARYFEDHLWPHGYRLVIGSTDENEENEKKLINLLATQNVDGVIVASTLKDPKPYNELKKSGCKVVFFDRAFEKAQVPSVSVDNKDGVMQAIQLFISLQYKNIGFLTLTPSYISPLKDRKTGFLEAIKKHKLPLTEHSVCEITYDELKESAQPVIANWLEKNNNFDAVLVANNTLSFELLKYLKSNSSVKAPKIISFDDHIAFELSSPTITAIEQPQTEIAKQTIEFMLQQLDKKTLKQREIVLPLRIVARQSHL